MRIKHSSLSQYVRVAYTHLCVCVCVCVCVCCPQNTKLLKTIEATKSVYELQRLQREAMEHAQYSRRLSNYRGPEHARYQPALSPRGVRESQDEAIAAKRPYSAQVGNLEPKEKQYTPIA